MSEFPEFQKIPRLKRACTITEKIDGTNALISIAEDGSMTVGSRTKWITPADDNYGFARWAELHRKELLQLGPGNHYGEWWGLGIQRRYNQDHKRFSLFNSGRWTSEQPPPSCCDVVPILYNGDFSTDAVDGAIHQLKTQGSAAAPGFMKPEGVIIYHAASRSYFKVTIEKDEEFKGKPNSALVVQAG